MKPSLLKPLTAFSEEYLAALREKDEPPSAPDGDVVGPWVVREHGDKFCLFREWESFEAGHTPMAEFTNREDALIFVAALRAIAAPPAYRVRTPSSPGSASCEVEKEGEVVGRFAYRREELLVAAHVLVRLTAAPADMAMLLDLSGSQVQEMARFWARSSWGENEALGPALERLDELDALLKRRDLQAVQPFEASPPVPLSLTGEGERRSAMAAWNRTVVRAAGALTFPGHPLPAALPTAGRGGSK